MVFFFPPYSFSNVRYLSGLVVGAYIDHISHRHFLSNGGFIMVCGGILFSGIMLCDQFLFIFAYPLWVACVGV